MLLEKSRGYAFVLMKDPSVADLILSSKLHIIDGREVNLFVLIYLKADVKLANEQSHEVGIPTTNIKVTEKNIKAISKERKKSKELTTSSSNERENSPSSSNYSDK